MRHGRRRAERQRVYRRRRAVAGALLLAILASILVSVRGEAPGEPTPAAAPAPAELPGGGTDLFPARRVVGFFGAPQDEALGALGIGAPEQAARRLERQARPYASEARPVLPAFELVTTIANASPGPEGLYRTRQRPGVVRTYLDAAREAGALLILDIQPGRADFMSEVRALEQFLEEPDVGIALDPEWHMGPGEVPGETIGSVDAATVNQVAAYLGDIVERNQLPEKLLLVHQFTEDMIEDRDSLAAPPGVALTINVDGFGEPDLKREKYRQFVGGRRGPQGWSAGIQHVGFKLFYEEDIGLLSPAEVVRLRPTPDVVVYE